MNGTDDDDDPENEDSDDEIMDQIQMVNGTDYVSRVEKHTHAPLLIAYSFQGIYAKMLRSYSKKYCTEIYLSPFLLYLPIVMMSIPMVLIMIDKFFIK